MCSSDLKNIKPWIRVMDRPPFVDSIKIRSFDQAVCRYQSYCRMCGAFMDKLPKTSTFVVRLDPQICKMEEKPTISGGGIRKYYFYSRPFIHYPTAMMICVECLVQGRHEPFLPEEGVIWGVELRRDISKVEWFVSVIMPEIYCRYEDKLNEYFNHDEYKFVSF